jgi:protein-disulfide isomerase-like protein with CxxC motif
VLRSHSRTGALRTHRGSGTLERPLLVYLFDAYCPWSYGYLPAVAHLLDQVGDEADLEVVSIGLHEGVTIAGAAVPTLAVERSTGVGFGPGYQEALAEGDLRLSSRDAAAAVIGMTAAGPGRATDVLWAVHRAFFWEGRSLSNGATVRDTANGLGLDGAAVEVFAASARAAEMAEEDFVLARDLGARRGPSLLISHGDRLCELEGPGTTGDQLVEQFRGVLARP